MDLEKNIQYLIEELSKKTSSKDLEQVIKFNEHREYGLAYEWICAEYIENDLLISEKGKDLLFKIYEFLKQDSMPEWEEMELEKKIHQIKIE